MPKTPSAVFSGKQYYPGKVVGPGNLLDHTKLGQKGKVPLTELMKYSEPQREQKLKSWPNEEPEEPGGWGEDNPGLPRGRREQIAEESTMLWASRAAMLGCSGCSEHDNFIWGQNQFWANSLLSVWDLKKPSLSCSCESGLLAQTVPPETTIHTLLRALQLPFSLLYTFFTTIHITFQLSL